MLKKMQEEVHKGEGVTWSLLPPAASRRALLPSSQRHRSSVWPLHQKTDRSNDSAGEIWTQRKPAEDTTERPSKSDLILVSVWQTASRSKMMWGHFGWAKISAATPCMPLKRKSLSEVMRAGSESKSVSQKPSSLTAILLSLNQHARLNWDVNEL